MTETVHIVLALRLPGVNIGYFLRIFAVCEFILKCFFQHLPCIRHSSASVRLHLVVLRCL